MHHSQYFQYKKSQWILCHIVFIIIFIHNYTFHICKECHVLYWYNKQKQYNSHSISTTCMWSKSQAIFSSTKIMVSDFIFTSRHSAFLKFKMILMLKDWFLLLLLLFIDDVVQQDHAWFQSYVSGLHIICVGTMSVPRLATNIQLLTDSRHSC